MGILSGWVVTIAGAVVLMHALEILMPEGEMNRYVKGVLAIVCMFVIVAPLPGLLNSEFSLSEFVQGDDYKPDYGFLDYIYSSRAKSLGDTASAELAEMGISATVTLSFSAGEEQFILSEVRVKTNSDRREEITKYLVKRLNITAEVIRYETGGE